MSKSTKQPSGAVHAEAQRKVARLASLIASELAPNESVTVTLTVPGEIDKLERNVIVTAVRHARPQLITKKTEPRDVAKRSIVTEDDY